VWEKIQRLWRGLKFTVATILVIGCIVVMVDIFRRVAAVYGPKGALLILIGIPVALVIVAIVLIVWYKRRDGRIRR
jgi:hypothetical protein